MRAYTKEVHQLVKVIVDENKFTEKFMKEFRGYLYDFYDIEDHVDHLAELYARGLVDNYSFIEGYGNATEFGIKFELIDIDILEEL